MKIRVGFIHGHTMKFMEKTVDAVDKSDARRKVRKWANELVDENGDFDHGFQYFIKEETTNE